MPAPTTPAARARTAGRVPGPTTPSPGARPMTPRLLAPRTGAPRGVGAAPAGPRTGPRGVPIGPDATDWELWWRYNRHRFLDLRRTVRAPAALTGSDDFFMGPGRRLDEVGTLRPSEATVATRILPALARAAQTNEREVVAANLLAMARVWPERADVRPLLQRLRHYLPAQDQLVRETAALALGVAQQPGAVPDLVDLACDTAAGRRLCRRSSVDRRTRAFACYGLGLVGGATTRSEVMEACFDALQTVLEQDTPDRDVPVAAIQAMRLLKPDPERGARHRRLHEASLDALWRFYERAAGQGHQIVQSHVPPAIARLLGRGGDTAGDYKDAFLADLTGRDGSRSNDLERSAALALGLLCEPREEAEADARYSAALLRYAQEGKDQQAKRFCLIALGQIGGDANRSALLRLLDRGSKVLVRPWAALGLGILTRQAQVDGTLRASDTALVTDAILEQLQANRNGDAQGAMAIALGLCGHRDAAEPIAALLRRYRQRDREAGWLCSALALLGHRGSTELIRSVVEDAEHRPALFERGTSALGKLGDKRMAADLVEQLRQPRGSLPRLTAIARALGWIGDRRTVPPLLDLLEDESVTPMARALAATALGGVAERQLLPWNADLAANINYRAAVETLTDGAQGVIDSL
ncbi:MAG: hypothetical protein AAF628_25615 [Planctomycetota bacterium]